MDDLKQTLEAILFSAARRIELEELARLARKTEQEVLDALNSWKAELETKPGPIMLVQDGTAWKLTVREKYLSVVKKVVTKTELPKSLLQTLAVVAYKAPVLQSAVIKVRTNKAYDHLNQLEESVLITREKKGRTKLIKLTPKFYDYFDIDPTQLKKKFHSMGDVEKAIEQKEAEIEQTGKDQPEKARHNLEAPQIKVHGKLEQSYDLPNDVEVFMEHLGKLEVYDVAKLERRHKQEQTEKIEKANAEPVLKENQDVTEEISSEEKISTEVQEKTKKLKKKTFAGKGLYPEGVPEDVEKRVDERVKEILEGEKKEETQ